MTTNRKIEEYAKKIKYLLILFLGAMILVSSSNAYTLPDTTRRDRPQPPPHPKPKSIKEIWTKINPFKKHKDSSIVKRDESGDRQAAVDPKPLPPPPAPPQPVPVKPKTTTAKHKSAGVKKKKTVTKPATTPDTKKTDKPTQPLI